MLFDEESKTEIDPNVERFRRGGGTYAMIRFRNKEDLYTFADLVDQPQLKTMQKNSKTKITWVADESERNALGAFF